MEQPKKSTSIVSPLSLEDRKRNIRRADFFAECHLNGIEFRNAVSAMDAANAQHEKWWINTSGNQQSHPNKKHRREYKTNVASHSHQNIQSQENNKEISSPLCHSPQEPTFEIKERLISMLVSATKDNSEYSEHKVNELVDSLSNIFARQQSYARVMFPQHSLVSGLEGLWLTLTKPVYTECLGRSSNGHWRYELGRLSFDRFRPCKLVCSIHHVVNNISTEYLHSNGAKTTKRRRYDIVASIILEPQDLGPDFQICRPIHGLLTTQGHCVEDPHQQNRLTVSFTGGLLELQDTQDLEVWRQIFQPNSSVGLGKTTADIIAERFLIGAESKPMQENGTIQYTMKNPIGGEHGQVFVDILFLDHSLRVLRGNHGSLFVSVRVPEEEDEETGDETCLKEEETFVQIG